MRKRQATPANDTAAPTKVQYKLERLFTDQDPDLVIDCIAPLLAWVPDHKASKLDLVIARCTGERAGVIDPTLAWDLPTLAGRIPGLTAHTQRLRKKTSAQREHVTELASYGLAFVAISALMPGRRVLRFHKGYAPDLLFDVTPTALKGVEVAGRSTGGHAALRIVRDGSSRGKGKALQLREAPHVDEAHLSLWCATPSVGLFEQVKP